MTPQERRAKRQAVAAKQATRIVEQATAKVVAARPSPTLPLQEGPELAAEVKRLRDSGMSWMAVGAKLSLPGAKNGAGAARRLYASVNRGEVPRSHAPRKGSTPKPSGPASKAVPAYLRKEALVRDGHVIPRDMSDEEVEALLVGRTIEWAIDMARLTGTDPKTWGPDDGRWCKQEAKVFPEGKYVYVGEEDSAGNRLVRFREYLGRDNNGTLMAGPTRTVRVDAIYTVR